jgi:hypothetical protein
MKVKRTERGWGGHYICAYRCLFRRNTLLECEDKKIVVSSVGLMPVGDLGRVDCKVGYEEIGFERHYETMAFHANQKDTRYYDVDVGRPVSFVSNWSISELDADDKANDMHEVVVDELTKKLENGNKL